MKDKSTIYWALFAKQCRIYKRVHKKYYLTLKDVVVRLAVFIAMQTVALILYEKSGRKDLASLFALMGIGLSIYTLDSVYKNASGHRQKKLNSIYGDMRDAARYCRQKLDPKGELAITDVSPWGCRADLAFAKGDWPKELAGCELYLLGNKHGKIMLGAPTEELGRAARLFIYQRYPDLYDSLAPADPANTIHLPS